MEPVTGGQEADGFVPGRQTASSPLSMALQDEGQSFMNGNDAEKGRSQWPESLKAFARVPSVL